MAPVSEMISTERDLLSQYSDSFNQKQADITQKWQAVLDRIDTSTATENDESTSLVQLQKQLDELSLGATLDKFKDMKTTLETKFEGYTTIVNNNNTVAASIFQNLQGTKDLVSEIMNVISDLDSNIAQINTTMDTYTATKQASVISA
jgi:prophage DNA circulation protein